MGLSVTQNVRTHFTAAVNSKRTPTCKEKNIYFSTKINLSVYMIIYKIKHEDTWVISKVLHTALARPVGRCNLSDFRDSCEPDFRKEQRVRIGRLRGPCSAKCSLEMEEETDWREISRSGQRSYINARPHASGAVSEILERYVWQVLPHPPYSPDMSPPAFDLFPKLKEPLRAKRFRSIEEVSNEVTRVIRRANNEGVLTGIQDLPKR